MFNVAKKDTREGRESEHLLLSLSFSRPSFLSLLLMPISVYQVNQMAIQSSLYLISCNRSKLCLFNFLTISVHWSR